MSMDKSIFADRLKLAREKSGMSLDEAATKSGCTKGTLWKYEKGQRVPKIPIAKELAKTLNVSFDWLIGYSDEMMPYDTPKIMDVYNKLSYSGKKQVFDYANYVLQKETTQDEQCACEYPVLGRTAAGAGCLHEEVKEYTTVNHVPKGADFALKVVGDSMEPMINDGGIIFVKKQEIVESGEIAVVEIDGETVCKKVYFEGGQLELRSINEKYPPRYPSAARIIGKVIL